MSTLLKITEYNDPGCPYGYSGEPNRRRIQWRYDGAIEIELRLVGLQDNPDELEDKWGYTPAMMMDGWRALAETHGMPFSFGLKRHSATIPACRAIVAARINGADDRALMRWLRIKRFSGEPIDDQTVIDAAALQAGIDPGELARWVASDETRAALDADMKATRSPSDEALALGHRLGSWEGGSRYSPPSWEIERVADGTRVSAPGLQPFEVYEVVLANLIPHAERRAAPENPLLLLEWAGEPLATREIAFVMEISDAEAEEALRDSAAAEIPLQSSSFWKV